MELFKENLKIIREHNNNKERTYFLKITPFSFKTEAERAEFLGTLTQENEDPTGNPTVENDLEEE